MSKTAIAEQLGINRRTITRWIQAGELDRDLDREMPYGPRPPAPSKLDPYKPILQARLEDYPRLTAVRLFEEIRAAGYPGSYSQVRDYVRRVRPQPPVEPIVRFETPPGRQAQVDFARFRLPWGIRHSLIVVLGYSRLLWLHYFQRQDMRTLIRGLEESFLFFGGVPHELLFDQMKTVITRDQRLRGGDLVHNQEFLRFAAHWGFTPRACRPHRAQTKGKVERPIRYIRESFFYAREFVNDTDLNQRAERWRDRVANVRIHQTTRERPIDRFERDERIVLTPLPQRRYHSLVLTPSRETAAPMPIPVPIDVERRPLGIYTQLVGGAR
jgi:transposase